MVSKLVLLCAFTALMAVQALPVSKVTGDMSSYALYGYDVVEYFNLDASDAGVQGSTDYQYSIETFDNTTGTSFGKFTFLFKDATNQKAFEADPFKYTPQWGGFCAWGIAQELPPRWPWAKDFMGPPADPENAWAIYNGKLYIAFHPNIMQNFLKDADTNVAAGDQRWNGWYGDATSGPFDIDCVAEVRGAQCVKTPQIGPSQ